MLQSVLTESGKNNWTIRFTQDNLAPMAAAMCLVGHIVDDLSTYRWEECLLELPTKEMFRIISGVLGGLKICYLYFDKVKCKWMRSGKTLGEGKYACFDGRGNKHCGNSESVEQKRQHHFFKSIKKKVP